MGGKRKETSLPLITLPLPLPRSCPPSVSTLSITRLYHSQIQLIDLLRAPLILRALNAIPSPVFSGLRERPLWVVWSWGFGVVLVLVSGGWVLVSGEWGFGKKTPIRQVQGKEFKGLCAQASAQSLLQDSHTLLSTCCVHCQRAHSAVMYTQFSNKHSVCTCLLNMKW